MDALVQALGAAFAAGFAVQQLLELVDLVFVKLKMSESTKKIVFSLLALGFGVVFTLWGEFEILAHLVKERTTIPRALDVMVTALVISAGTEGFNEILKFLGYAKKNQREQAEKTKAEKKEAETRANAV